MSFNLSELKREVSEKPIETTARVALEGAFFIALGVSVAWLVARLAKKE